MEQLEKSQRISVITIGAKLKAARESKSLSIGEVQKQTHIHSTVLNGLEEGRCDEILTPNYVKSFLAKYAAFLGLDSKELTGQYASLHPDMPGRAEPRKTVEPQGASSGLLKFIYFAKYATVAIAVSVAVMVSFKVVEAVIKKITASKPGLSWTAPEKSSSGKSIAVSRRKSAGTSSGKAAAAASDQKSASSIAVSGRSSAGAISPVLRERQVTVVIRAKQRVMVELKTDGKVIFKRVLDRGTAEYVKAKERVNLYIGKAEAVELVVNGKTIPPIGKGVIRNLEITGSGARPR